MNAYSVKQQLDIDIIKIWRVLCFVRCLITSSWASEKKFLRFGLACFEYRGYYPLWSWTRLGILALQCTGCVILSKPHNLAELLPQLQNLSLHLTGLVLGEPVKFLM